MSGEAETGRIFWLVLDATFFFMSRDLFTDLTTGKPRFELSYRGNLQQPFEFKIVNTEK